MGKQKEQRSLFSKQELPDGMRMSPELRRVLLIFQNASREGDRLQALRYFVHYGYKQSDENSPGSLEGLIDFFRKFRELRRAGRQYMEQQFFDVLKAFISNSYITLKRPDKPRMSIDKGVDKIGDEEIDNALAILVKITDFIEETLNYKPSGKDVLNPGRKAMAVKLIEGLVYCIKYPRLYDILLQALLSNYKAAVLTALDVIFYNELKNSKIKEALGIVARTTKDGLTRHKAEKVLLSWEQ